MGDLHELQIREHLEQTVQWGTAFVPFRGSMDERISGNTLRANRKAKGLLQNFFCSNPILVRPVSARSLG